MNNDTCPLLHALQLHVQYQSHREQTCSRKAIISRIFDWRGDNICVQMAIEIHSDGHQRCRHSLMILCSLQTLHHQVQTSAKAIAYPEKRASHAWFTNSSAVTSARSSTVDYQQWRELSVWAIDLTASWIILYRVSFGNLSLDPFASVTWPHCCRYVWWVSLGVCWCMNAWLNCHESKDKCRVVFSPGSAP
jgi:hypothetical protein